VEILGLRGQRPDRLAGGSPFFVARFVPCSYAGLAVLERPMRAQRCHFHPGNGHLILTDTCFHSPLPLSHCFSHRSYECIVVSNRQSARVFCVHGVAMKCDLQVEDG